MMEILLLITTAALTIQTVRVSIWKNLAEIHKENEKHLEKYIAKYIENSLPKAVHNETNH